MKIDESVLDDILRNHLTDVSSVHPTMMDWFFISSVGSMNYSLDDEHSDIDSKLVLIPSMYYIIHSESMVSREQDVSRAFYSGICSIYDMRKYFSYLLKQNPNFIETLFAKGTLVNPKYKEEFEELRSIREEIAYCDPARTISSLRGMMVREFNKVMASNGKDSKAAYHYLRLCSMLSDFYRGLPYKEILSVGDGPFGELILKIKQGKQDPKRVEELCQKFYTNEATEYKFFVTGNGPREWNKNIIYTITRMKIDAIQAKLIRKVNEL